MDKYILSIGMFPKVNSDFWHKITSYFTSYQETWESSINSLVRAGIKESVAIEFENFKKATKPDRIIELYQKYQISYIMLTDKKYPKKLKEIYSPPFILYYRGAMPEFNKLTIGVVGARKFTDYGRRVTSDITTGLTKAGTIIVSGLALGLDTEAHRATLNEKGITIAVLANGLDKIYPSSNTALGNDILKSGAVISEKPIGMPPLKQNFPARNRIISGLSDGILVTEAGEHSGTLHTANFAIEQNRNVYAVPGPIYNEMAKGPNSLIKLGAKPVSSAQDVLEDFGIDETSEEILPGNENEKLIFDILCSEPKHLDLISKESNRRIEEISQIITLMEIKGKVKHLGGMVYTLKR